ncbi:TIR domain-containing protein [Tolypothrix sp. VBCCA 56010]|uniref:toll/interleukin-1 receptor domain-containing protein n=1 Tax=Tolypothrix sp. VBCCA 56010 TaxID=3137731 RepID=UPI003D7C4382
MMTDNQQFDVFFAHNSKDKPQVRVIAQELKQQGLNPWIDEEQIHPGDPIPTKVLHGILQSRNFAFFVGSEGFGKFQGFWELDALIMFSAKSNLRIIPILLPGVEDLPKEQALLASRRYLQFHRTVDETEPLNELIKILNNKMAPELIYLPQQNSEKKEGVFSSLISPNNSNAVRREIITKTSNIFAKIFAEEENVGIPKLLVSIKSILGVKFYNLIYVELSKTSYREFVEKLINKGRLDEFIEVLLKDEIENLGSKEKKNVVAVHKEIISLLNSLDK